MEPYAYEAGLRPWEIGRMTPAELLAVIEAHQRATIAAAWWQEYFAREKRLKPLRHYLKPPKDPKPVEERRREYEDLKVRLGYSASG